MSIFGVKLNRLTLGENMEEKITRQAVRDNIKKAEEKLEFFESKLKLYKNFKKEDNIVSKLEKNVINLTVKITTLSIDKYEKEKLDNTLKEIIKNVDSLKKI